MATAITKTTERTIARPLKVLIPMIQSELQQGNDAGREHYLLAGQMLIEAKDQVGYGRWGQWLTKNFDLSKTTANVYMRWARERNDLDGGAVQVPYRSMRDMTGHTERRREDYQDKRQKDFREALRDVPRDNFIQERQARENEIKLHRELAEELIDLGYKAMAMRLHPDRGGSKDAMARLNRVRDELRQVAQNRRFV